MQVRIHISPDDLTNIRFAYSPLVELTTSYRILHNPALQTPYLSWADEAQRALHDVELPYLHALLGSKCSYMPDFLTPTPLTTRLDVEAEIQIMLNLPAEIIRANVEKLIDDSGDSEIRQYFLVYPREMILCLADEMRLYWQRVLAHHWQRVTSVLEGDILYRARHLALHGAIGLFADLSPKMHYQPGQITIQKHNTQHAGEDYSLNGQGLQLVPTVFFNHGVWWQIVPEWHPMLVYHARGVGLWRQREPETNESLEIALGTGRARVLQSLTTPLNTGEIARLLNITSAGVSQHLARLQQAGLVEPHRSGKRVYYQLTRRGANLLNVFDQSY